MGRDANPFVLVFVVLVLVAVVAIALFVNFTNFQVFITGNAGSGGSGGLGGIVSSGNLSALWHFNEAQWTGAGGEVRDSIGSAHGTAGGATVVSEGIGGRAARLDGTNDVITIPDQDSIDVGQGNFSISFWVKGNSFITGRKLLAKTNVDTNNTGYGIWTEGTSGLDLKIGIGTANRNIGVGNLADGQWHQVVFAINRSGTSRGYRDGVQVSSLSGGVFLGEDISNSNSLLIGANLGSLGAEQFFNGFIDEVHFYPTALSSQEVGQAYSAESAALSTVAQPQPVSYLVAQYLLNESGWSSGAASVANNVSVAAYGTARNGANTSVVGSVRVGTFDGVDDAVEISSTPRFDLPAFSIAAWVYPRAASQHGGIFEKTIGGATNSQYVLLADVSDYKFRVKQTSGSLVTISSPGLAAGTWVHLAGTFNGTDLSLYRNGALVSSAHASGIARGSGVAYIGALGSSAGTLNGSLSDVRFYNTSLSSGNVSALYAETSALYNILPPPVSSISIDSCRQLSEQARYVLTRNITVNNETCFVFLSDNVTLDGRGYSLIANVSIDPLDISLIGSYGIRATGKRNLAIFDIGLEQFQFGISLSAVNQSLIEGVSVSSSTFQGLFLNRSFGNTIRASSFIGNNDGIVLYGSSNNTFASNDIIANEDYGMLLLQYSQTNAISSSRFSDNGFGAIHNDSTSTGNQFSSISYTLSPSAGAARQVIEPLQLASGYSAFVGVGDTLSFRLLNGVYNLTVTAITGNRVQMAIRRTTMLNVTLAAGENYSADVSGNSIPDLLVQVRRLLSDGRAEVKLTSIRETAGLAGAGGGTGGQGGTSGGTGSGGSGAFIGNQSSPPLNISRESSTVDVISYILGGLIVVILFILIGWFIWLNYSSRLQPFAPHEDTLFRPEPHSNILQR